MFRQFTMFLTVSILCAGLLLVSGCGTSGRSVITSEEDSADIDQLLGLGENGDENIDEDAVLKLLGVDDEAVDMESNPQNFEEAGSSVEQSGATSFGNAGASEESGSGMAYKDSETIGSNDAYRRVTGNAFQDRYIDARQAYNAKRYREALQKFEALLTEDIRNSLSDNCQYWLAESHYGLGDFQNAIAAFEKVFSFPKSNKWADAQLKIGLCYLKLNNTEKAREELQKLIDNYPTSEYVSLARKSLSQIGQPSAP